MTEEGYDEEHVWPLTSSTSCYTGARGIQNCDNSASVDVRWATQWHTCKVHLEAYSHQQKRSPSLQSREVVPLDDEKGNCMQCVGYMATATWEALALLDASKTEATAQQSSPTQAPQQSQPLPDDDASVTAASGSHRRNSSFMSSSESSLPPLSQLALDASSMNMIGNNSADFESALSGDLAMDTVTLGGVGGGEESVRAETIAQLILRRATIGEGGEYSTSLDFRPLAVTVCDFFPLPRSDYCAPENDSAADDAESIIRHANINNGAGIWLGSADNSKLHCFVPSDHGTFHGGNERSLVPVALEDHPAFSFSTPVMAIRVVTIASASEPLHCLAVACQDGTIRLVTFRCNSDCDRVAGLVFQEIRHNQVIIDGPIVCLHVQQTERNGRTSMHVTAGSLCGYVAELYWEDPEHTMEWRGPYMVAEGFWNARLNAEDSVLAVHAAASTVVMGTHAGRCLVYHKLDDETLEESGATAGDDEDAGGSYQLQWDCQLPYPVLAVFCLPDDRLLVTTRRTVHIFRKSRRCDASVVAAASLAKERLLLLLAQQQEEQQRMRLIEQRQQTQQQDEGHPSSTDEALTELTPTGEV